MAVGAGLAVGSAAAVGATGAGGSAVDVGEAVGEGDGVWVKMADGEGDGVSVGSGRVGLGGIGVDDTAGMRVAIGAGVAVSLASEVGVTLGKAGTTRVLTGVGAAPKSPEPQQTTSRASKAKVMRLRR